MSTASRLLLGRGLRWLIIALLAAALLVLLVDWVEHSSRIRGPGGAPALLASLRVVLLLLPAHLSRAAPIAAGLGAALTVVVLRRSGEWQALGAAGLGPARLLAPFVLLGGLTGAGSAALDAWAVPPSTRAYDRAMAQHDGRPLRMEGWTWVEIQGVYFQIATPIEGDHLDTACATVIRQQQEGSALSEFCVERLDWDGGIWEPQGESFRSNDPASTAHIDPWLLLPPPEQLAQLAGDHPPSGRSWSTLMAEDSPDAAAERQARWSRPFAAILAALVAAALAALLQPGSLTVLLALGPVLTWELLATMAQAQAALGAFHPAGSAAARIGVGLLVAALAWRRLQRP
jgi:lipopolysaccharide export LptBFGC system permease protein LptF